MDSKAVKVTAFIDRIARATSSGAIAWKDSLVDTEFIATMTAGSLRVRKLEDRVHGDSYELLVMNDEGKLAERITGFDQVEREQIEEIWVEARRISRGADAVINSIYEELSEPPFPPRTIK